MDLGYQINACSRAFKHVLNTALSPVDLTAAQYAVLKSIEAFEREDIPATAVRISKRLDLDKPTISGIIQRLCNKNYIVKEKDPIDQRSFHLKLSQLGCEKMDNLDAVSAKIVNQATNGLSEQDQQTLSKWLMILVQNLNEEGF